MSVIIVATFVPIPEHRAEVLSALEELIGQVHAEDGCELYALHEGKDCLVILEKWASAEALRNHGQGPALHELNRRLDGRIISDPDGQILRPHPAGTIAKGTI